MVDGPLTFGVSPSFGAAGGFGGVTPLPSTAGTYTWGGPTNVGSTQYATGGGGIGNAGLRAYNPAISGPPAPFQAPVYSNSMSNWLGGPTSANSAAAYATMFGHNAPGAASPVAGPLAAASNVPSPFATNMTGVFSGGGGATGGWDLPGAGGGAIATNPYALGAPRAPDPGRNSTLWDPQNQAYNYMYGLPGSINPDLAANNLQRYATGFGGAYPWRNQQAPAAMGTVMGAESSGDVLAINNQGTGRPSSGAAGGNQWMGPRLTNANAFLQGDVSPENQGRFAAHEILSGGYPSVYAALNNPNASMAQMQRSGIANFEGLRNDPRQMASDVAGAARYNSVFGPGSAYAGGRY